LTFSQEGERAHGVGQKGHGDVLDEIARALIETLGTAFDYFAGNPGEEQQREGGRGESGEQPTDDEMAESSQ